MGDGSLQYPGLRAARFTPPQCGQVIREQDFTRPGPPRWDTGYPSFLEYCFGRRYASVEGRSTEVEFRFVPGTNDSDGHRSSPFGVAYGREGTSGQSYVLCPPRPSVDGGQSPGVTS